MKKLAVSLLILLMFSCDKDDTNPINNDNEFKTDTIEIVQDQNSPTINKGFYGYIFKWEGDFMPGMDSNEMGTIQPVQMNLYVYHKLTFDSIKNARTEPYSLFWY
ncbi:MAG: hypothetical protein JW702_08245 [Clostridiales bacterium]|nr:hypothetical protein [Clostridiales bacterium]